MNINEGKFGFSPGGILLLSPFAKILSGILLAGLLASSVFTVVKVFEVKNLEIKLSETEKSVEDYKHKLEMCLTQIDDQNKEIAEIKADAQQDIDNIKKINQDLSTLTKKQRQEIERLKSRPAPENCDETRDWLRENLDIFEEIR